MTIADAFAPYESFTRAKVEAQTFGHLAPKPKQPYKLTILFCNSEYRYTIPIRVETENLPDSPWFYEDMQGFIDEQAQEVGRVYRFEGTYRKFKNGNCKFTGTTAIVV